MRGSIEPEILSSLIGMIYDCAVDPERWQDTTEALRDVLGTHNGQLGLFEIPTGRPLIMVTVGIEPEHLARQEHFGPALFDLWQPLLNDPARPLDTPLCASRELTAEHMAGNAYVTQWAAPQGVIDALGLLVMREETRAGSFGFGLHRSKGPATDAQIALLGLLAPHLRRAVVISNLLDVTRIAAARLEQALDALTYSVFLVADDLEVRHANRAGRAVLDAGEVMQLRQGRLNTTIAASRDALLRAVQASGQGADAIGGSGIGVPLRSATGKPAVAHVLPLAAGATSSRAWMRGASAAIFLSPGTSMIPVDALIALYDFTPAEARVLVEIAKGRTPAEAGLSLGIAESTVKTHLARVFSKTGTGRQTELALLVKSLALPV